MNRTNNGTPGTDANAIVKQEAVAAHVLYNLQLNNFTFTQVYALRSIKVSSLNYGTADLTRAGTNLTQAVNRVNVWIPGMGVYINSTTIITFFYKYPQGVHLQVQK
jgi:Fe(3+) dicitrate transport protein